MIRKLKYSFAQGFHNFTQNGAMSAASVIIITACLALFGLYIVFGINLNYVSQQVQSQFQVDVYMMRSLGESGIRDIGDQLKKMENIKEITYVSKSEAFKELENMFADNPEATVGYDAENLNPLMASYRLSLSEFTDVDAMKKKIEAMDGVHHVNSKDDAMDTMLSTVETIRSVSLWVMLVLAGISILIISNTIRMTVFARRKEINIMKFIGATDGFIRRPFIIEGMIIGIVGALLALCIVSPLYSYFVVLVTKLLKGILELKSLLDILPIMGASFILFGGLLGAIGSWISIKKHLKV
ncbi:MAG: permease-like cell division protein FtsX [Eubacteriales bacterium]|nr:permease-like cell division protein FtsX [Eubacteriales bacterium]